MHVALEAQCQKRERLTSSVKRDPVYIQNRPNATHLRVGVSVLAEAGGAKIPEHLHVLRAWQKKNFSKVSVQAQVLRRDATEGTFLGFRVTEFCAERGVAEAAAAPAPVVGILILQGMDQL